MAVDRGTYRKLTYHPTDISGRHEFEHGKHAPDNQRRNHLGQEDTVAAHTLLASENPWLTGAEAEAAWYPPGHPKHDPALYDPEFLQQAQAGHTKSDDCAPRRATTAWMAAQNIVRPTPVHW